MTKQEEDLPAHKMVSAIWYGLQARGCTSSEGCPTLIKPGDEYLRDHERGTAYCIPCGQRLRYHRKKALERGEAIPKTFIDVEARFAAAGV